MVKWHQLMQYCMWLWLLSLCPPTSRWQAHWHITEAWLFLQAVVVEKISKQTSEKKVSRGREVAAVWWCGWNILHVFLTFIWTGRLWHTEISSHHTDENWCVGNENLLLRSNPWHPFWCLFFFFPFSFCLHLCCKALSAVVFCTVFSPDNTCQSKIWAASEGFLL